MSRYIWCKASTTIDPEMVGGYHLRSCCGTTATFEHQPTCLHIAPSLPLPPSIHDLATLFHSLYHPTTTKNDKLSTTFLSTKPNITPNHLTIVLNMSIVIIPPFFDHRPCHGKLLEPHSCQQTTSSWTWFTCSLSQAKACTHF